MKKITLNESQFRAFITESAINVVRRYLKEQAEILSDELGELVRAVMIKNDCETEEEAIELIQDTLAEFSEMGIEGPSDFEEMASKLNLRPNYASELEKAHYMLNDTQIGDFVPDEMGDETSNESDPELDNLGVDLDALFHDEESNSFRNNEVVDDRVNATGQRDNDYDVLDPDGEYYD